jgi:hypothetical protein
MGMWMDSIVVETEEAAKVHDFIIQISKL